LREKWTQLFPAERDELLAILPRQHVICWLDDFPAYGHPHQMPPELTPSGEPWTTWLILGGRGAGKTRAGAEWVRRVASAMADEPGNSSGRIALIGESEHDVRE
jgi:phage terminase large subunit-like protein